MKRRSVQGEEDSEHHPNKQRHLPPILFELLNDERVFVSSFEPIFRKVVREEVDGAFTRFLRNSRDQASAGSRTLQLQFHSNLPCTLYTGNRVVSDSDTPVKIVLYDSISQKTVTSGPLSSIKVRIVALDSEFVDRENWRREEFEEKIIGSRQGKRPLVTGELVVTLRDGVGYVGDVSFTDNSSWMRSGKFRLGSKANSDHEIIREGISNSFRVKDHRGESYQKHHPPSSDDQVWRLEKIGKEGASHRKLTRHGIFNVGDFLRLYFTDQSSLRAMLKISNRKNWDAIIGHAITCTLADDNKYMYKTAQGTTGLLFNSVYKNIGVTFDGQSYQSVDNLNIHQKKTVEDLKQIAYRNINDWVPVSQSSTVGYPLLLAPENFNLCPQDTQFQNQPPYYYNNNNNNNNGEVEQQNNSSSSSSAFEIGHHQDQVQAGGGFDFKDSFGMMNDSTPDGLMFCTWAAAADNDIIPVDQDHDFDQVESSLWQGGNHEIGIINPGIQRPKTSWWKILAVVKWRILARRNVAARKWKCLL
ncbi:hypothetical protein ACJIZ3_015919 [Penstemon smallii]|uniref:Uncharacterized protein n=1 Tax=Penstemon smallii TaxID=265156 RepID=A0ABD3RS91_9LAMI